MACVLDRHSVPIFRPGFCCPPCSSHRGQLPVLSVSVEKPLRVLEIHHCALYIYTCYLFPYRFCSTLDVRAYDAARSDAGSVGLDTWHARLSQGHHTPAPVRQSPQDSTCANDASLLQNIKVHAVDDRGQMQAASDCMRVRVVASRARDCHRDVIVTIVRAAVVAACRRRLRASRALVAVPAVVALDGPCLVAHYHCAQETADDS